MVMFVDLFLNMKHLEQVTIHDVIVYIPRLID